MNSVKDQSILIVEPDEHLREKIFNFLLSAGYEKTEATDNLAVALDKIRRSAYEVVVADAGEPLTAGQQFATDLAQLSPNIKIILMIRAEDQQSWDQIAAQSIEIQILIKTDITRNLLYLLEESAQT